MSILSQYGPDLLTESQNALDLSRKLVSEWFEKYMFVGQTSCVPFACRFLYPSHILTGGYVRNLLCLVINPIGEGGICGVDVH
jgi:hypothetical protein